ncbi:MAG: spore coat protein, partial [Flavobacteriales bacterium]|nr:spore coat protein [Flavobacteriales bacterium]
NSYWTFVSKLENPAISWTNFRDKFQEFGGDGIYAPWKLTYQEPFYNELKNKEEDPYCPVAEKLQKTLLQFKTNYWKWEEAEKQAEILQKTIQFFK